MYRFSPSDVVVHLPSWSHFVVVRSVISSHNCYILVTSHSSLQVGSSSSVWEVEEGGLCSQVCDRDAFVVADDFRHTFAFVELDLN